MSMAMIICRRELANYFSTPLAYIFILIFLVMSSALAFYFGGLFERGQADLQPFFNYHPWLYLFLVPAIAMRSWAEERKSGTIELLLTLPISIAQAMIGKFLAAWIVIGICLVFTFPIWITLNYLGNPDNGVILAAYIGSWMMSAGYLAIGMCMSALSKSQVVAFIVAVVVCFLFMLTGTPMMLGIFENWMHPTLVDALASISFSTHFMSISQGVIALNDVIYFSILTLSWLTVALFAIERTKAR